MSGQVKLANESALGTYRLTWTSGDGARMGLTWGAGMTGPLAFRGGACREVARPERFGWKVPRNLREFRDFVQRFADAFEADE